MAKKKYLKDILDTNILIYDIKYDGKSIIFYFKLNHKSKDTYYCKIASKAALRQCIPICEVLEKKPLSKYTKTVDSFYAYYPKYKVYKQYTVIDKYLCGKIVYDNWYTYGNYAGKAYFFEFYNTKVIYPDNLIITSEMR